MPYREKIAWLTVVAMAITFGPYFVFVRVHGVLAGPLLPNVRQLVLFGVTTVVQGLIIAAGQLYLRYESPEDARTPLDERDQAIMRNSIISAYYSLMAGTVLVGVVMPFNSSGWTIINAALFMIVIAEFVHHGVTIFSYRKQA